eukprot:Rmarinus@m.27101
MEPDSSSGSTGSDVGSYVLVPPSETTHTTAEAPEIESAVATGKDEATGSPDLEEDDDEGAVCRICRIGSPEDLCSPCKCRGSVQYVHQECLQQWLNQKKSEECELCGYTFKFDLIYSPDAPGVVSVWEVLLSMALRCFGTLMYCCRFFFSGDDVGSGNPYGNVVPFSLMLCHVSNGNYILHLSSEFGRCCHGLLPRDYTLKLLQFIFFRHAYNTRILCGPTATAT